MLYAGHKTFRWATGQSIAFIKAIDADIDTGKLDLDETWSMEEPTTLWGKFWDKVC